MFRLARINKRYRVGEKYLFSTSVKNISVSMLSLLMSYSIASVIYGNQIKKEDLKIKVSI